MLDEEQHPSIFTQQPTP